jgi:hypothetical protein
MCKFFSLVSEPKSGRVMFFDASIRKALSENNEKKYEYDSHTSIADYFGYAADKEDHLNKYEYDVFNKKLVIDQQNGEDDFDRVKAFCDAYDFSEILEDGFFDLDLSHLTSADGLKLPATVGGSLDLSSLTSADGLKLPTKVGGSLYLCSLTSADGLKLPATVGGSLDLSSLTDDERERIRKEFGK